MMSMTMHQTSRAIAEHVNEAFRTPESLEQGARFIRLICEGVTARFYKAVANQTASADDSLSPEVSITADAE